MALAGKRKPAGGRQAFPKGDRLLSQPSAHTISDENAWAALVDPLSVSERALLTRFRARMRTAAWAAADFMDAHGELVTAAQARHLGFARWMAETGRLSEEVSA